MHSEATDIRSAEGNCKMSGATICAAATAFVAAIVTCKFVLNDSSSLLRLGAHESFGADDLSKNYLLASRTGYHFQPERNWMNGPMFYKGYYHFFYQYNPSGVSWGRGLAWGHAVSTDLIHWKHLDLAMIPDKWYDIEGVWSGSATILRNGTPAVLYTGVRSAFSPDEGVQSQNLAVPVDPADALLRKWKKANTNPVLSNPHTVKAQDLRDPTTAWLEKDGLWRIVVGGKRDDADGSTNGIALLFKSEDFIRWDLEKTIYEVKGSVLWECVDFYPLRVKGDRPARVDQNDSASLRDNYEEASTYVIKASLYRFDHDYYTLGTYSTETHTFAAYDADRDVGLGQSLLYDYGKFYASKTFFDSRTGRRILWAWVNESDSGQDHEFKGWASLQAIPRTVWLDDKTNKSILQWPIEEVEELRETKASLQNVLLPPSAVLKVEDVDGPQVREYRRGITVDNTVPVIAMRFSKFFFHILLIIHCAPVYTTMLAVVKI